MSIRLRSRRGAIGTTWQGRALREAAEGILGVGRASGGKADARAGRVQWLDVSVGTARAEVLDADGQLYGARIDLPPLRGGDREAVLAVARAHPELAARFAAGEYPEDIERELARSEVSLLPRGASELSHDCSCMDWPGPCRHVAALAYVLVEAVDETPTHLLTLRGLELGDLVASPESARRGAPDGIEGDEATDGSSGSASAGGSVQDPADGAGASASVRPAEDDESLPAARFDPTRLRAEDISSLVGETQARLLTSFFHAGRGEDLQ